MNCLGGKGRGPRDDQLVLVNVITRRDATQQSLTCLTFERAGTVPTSWLTWLPSLLQLDIVRSTIRPAVRKWPVVVYFVSTYTIHEYHTPVPCNVIFRRNYVTYFRWCTPIARKICSSICTKQSQHLLRESIHTSVVHDISCAFAQSKQQEHHNTREPVVS